jgi:hypothetical protein
LQVGDTGPVESARRSNSRVLGSPFSGLSGQFVNISNVICLYSDMHENPATWTGRLEGWPPSLDYFSKVIRSTGIKQCRYLQRLPRR